MVLGKKQTIGNLFLTAGHDSNLEDIESVASLRVPALLVEFCQQYPNVRLTLETRITEVISQQVAEGKLDLGICSLQYGIVNLKAIARSPSAVLMPQR